MLALGRWTLRGPGKNVDWVSYELPISEFDADLEPIFVVTLKVKDNGVVQEFYRMEEVKALFRANGWKQSRYLGFYSKEWATAPMNPPEGE